MKLSEIEIDGIINLILDYIDIEINPIELEDEVEAYALINETDRKVIKEKIKELLK